MFWGEIVVISPHLDDAVLSLGATIAAASRASAAVTVLTVLAGDTESDASAGRWDVASGFATAGEAARVRRGEDARACAILGATPSWLPFGDEQYARGGTAEDVWAAVEPRLAAADLVLVPACPLTNDDHVWLTDLLLRRVRSDLPLAVFVEQPYAVDKVVGRGYSRRMCSSALGVALRTPGTRARQTPSLPPAIADLVRSPVCWAPSRTDRRDRLAKGQAIQAYESQLAGLGRRLLPRIRLYERAYGGEGIGFLDHSPAGKRARS